MGKGALRYSIRLRARPSEPMSDRHERFLEAVTRIEPPWGWGPTAKGPALEDRKGSPFVVVSLSKFLGKGIRGSVDYIRRFSFSDDHGSEDDTLVLRFAANPTAYQDLVRNALPEYIRSLAAYRCLVGPEDLLHIDFEEDTGDSRDTLYRFYPVTYVDAELCKRALGITPKHLLRALKGVASRTLELAGGAYIVGDDLPMDLAASRKFDASARAALGIPRAD